MDHARLPCLAALLLLAGCTSKADTAPGTPSETGETGAAPYTPRPDGEPTRLLDDDHVLVVPTASGLDLLDADGQVAWSAAWDTLVPGCVGCVGEGATPDGDGLLVTWSEFVAGGGPAGALQGGFGAVAPPATATALGPDGLSFPHDAVRDPSDGTVIVAEAFASRLAWYAGDDPSPVRLLDDDHPAWTGLLPNGLEPVDIDGAFHLLVTTRGDLTKSPSEGRIELWDLSDPALPALAWRYPADGGLDSPHGAVIRWHDGRFWLLYAHTGVVGNGTIGLAVTDDRRVAPAYVADLVPDATGLLDFARAVDLTDDGVLVITDTGGLTNDVGTGRLLTAPWPDLEPSGLSGAAFDDQRYALLRHTEILADGLLAPFEAWLWPTPDL